MKVKPNQLTDTRGAVVVQCPPAGRAKTGAVGWSKMKIRGTQSKLPRPGRKSGGK